MPAFNFLQELQIESLQFYSPLHSLTKDVEHRPHYTELLQHPLIKKYERESVDIALWFSGVCKKHGLRQDKTYIHMK